MQENSTLYKLDRNNYKILRAFAQLRATNPNGKKFKILLAGLTEDIEITFKIKDKQHAIKND